MVREKIPIKKIDNVTARQVTFAKRRRGLFKKAEELAVLCGADVGVIIFSSTGKLFEYSNSSMKEILERRYLHSKNLEKLEQPPLELQLVENSDVSKLRKELAEQRRKLRQLRGEELQGLSVKELLKIEKSLETGLTRVSEKKDEKIANQISYLQQKGQELQEENERLRQRLNQQVMEVTNGRGQMTSDSDVVMGREEAQSSESATNISNSADAPPRDDESSDISISLKLGWY